MRYKLHMLINVFERGIPSQDQLQVLIESVRGEGGRPAVPVEVAHC